MAPAKLSQEVAERFGDIVASDDKLLAECALSVIHAFPLRLTRLNSRHFNLQNLQHHPRKPALQMGSTQLQTLLCSFRVHRVPVHHGLCDCAQGTSAEGLQQGDYQEGTAKVRWDWDDDGGC